MTQFTQCPKQRPRRDHPTSPPMPSAKVHRVEQARYDKDEHYRNGVTQSLKTTAGRTTGRYSVSLAGGIFAFAGKKEGKGRKKEKREKEREKKRRELWNMEWHIVASNRILSISYDIITAKNE
mmetsp:Transcript_23103/g.50022  ORF Transcript_23103/g.50022 Transcript_23103/m.50022 type:complete len:123 (+) Transcript_23103:222-590(+)